MCDRVSKTAMDLAIWRTVGLDSENLTLEAKHRAGLEVAQPLSTVLRGKVVIGNGYHFCRARYVLDLIPIFSRLSQ